MPISMLFDSFNPKRVPTLQFKAIRVLKGCSAPACILSPLPHPITPISIVTLRMLDIFNCFDAFRLLQPQMCANITIQKNMGAKRVPGSRLHTQTPATSPYSYRHSGPGDALYMPISMYFDSFNLKRVPTLQFKSMWVLKGCPAPACILSPQPRPLPIST